MTAMKELCAEGGRLTKHRTSQRSRFATISERECHLLNDLLNDLLNGLSAATAGDVARRVECAAPEGDEIQSPMTPTYSLFHCYGVSCFDLRNEPEAHLRQRRNHSEQQRSEIVLQSGEADSH